MKEYKLTEVMNKLPMQDRRSPAPGTAERPKFLNHGQNHNRVWESNDPNKRPPLKINQKVFGTSSTTARNETDPSSSAIGWIPLFANGDPAIAVTDAGTESQPREKSGSVYHRETSPAFERHGPKTVAVGETARGKTTNERPP
jgi:hypothetical protein